jgi:integrase
MGVTVRQKVKGKGEPWWVFVAHNGKRWSKRVGSLEAARKLKAIIEEKLKTGELRISDEKTIPTFGEYTRKVLDNVSHLKHSTAARYEGILKNHLGALRDQPLDLIKRADVKELIFAKQKKGGMAPGTVKNIQRFISRVFSDAVEDELVTMNPAARLGKHINSKEYRFDISPLTRDEARVFLDTIQAHYPRHYPFFLCALRTGMRLGELLALQWGDIDFHGGFIEVRRSFTRGHYTTPKNGKTRRVDMSPQLAEILKELRTERKRETLARGWREVPDLLFVDKAGHLEDSSNLRKRVFHPALEKAGLRHVRIHDLRHTVATMLIQNGESLAYVRDQLGHSSIQITVDIYGHLEPGKNRQAVAKLDDDFSTYGQKVGCSGGADLAESGQKWQG